MPATLEQIEAYLLAYLLDEAHSPEARAILARLVAAAEASIESATSNPSLRALEAAAFAVVKGYLAP